MRQDRAMTNHFVVIVAYDGLRTFEFGSAVEIFALSRPELNVNWYRFAVCSADGPSLQALGGVTVTVPLALDLLDDADTIIIPGWRDVNQAPPEPLLAGLRRAYQRGARICSICTGVFVIAAAGLLKGKTVTTHWHHTHLLASRYPELRVQPTALYVDDGQILTSAGSAAGLDMLLHLVQIDFGYRVANLVAQRLVLPAHRAGWQQQLVKKPVAENAENSISLLTDWIRENITLPHSVDSLARRMMMSQRTFQRGFQQAMGQPVMQWITQIRIAQAKELLVSTCLPMSRIAMRCGFACEGTLRHHFKKSVRQSPMAFRRTMANEKKMSASV